MTHSTTLLDFGAFLLEPHNIAATVLCLTVLALIRRHLSKPSLPLPPGPPGNWLLGNTLPKAFSYRKFEDWAKEYGPVFKLRQGTTTIIVINRMQAAIDIMEKEGAALADRPAYISAGETLSGGMRLLLTPAGERFKKMRRALHSHLQPKVINNASPILQRNARQFIIDILLDPDRHQNHAKRYSASVVMSLAYGKNPPTFEDPDVQAVSRCLTRLADTMRPGVWKVDVFPFWFLKYVPGYLKELRDGHAEELALFKRQLNDVRTKMQQNEEVPQSFGKYLIERQAELELTDDETAYLAGSMFGAGSDTTASGISIAVMAAATHPEAQRRVQEELDAVLGGKAPVLADQNNLPQTMAFVIETFRWRPVTAGGFAHKATKDIIWNNYLIPKGASVYGNVWAVGRDPEYFPDPERFDPQRWIDKSGKLREDLKSYAFGFGRRVCPGQAIATSSVFLNTALLQWAFTIKELPSSPIDPLAFSQGANTHPLSFRVEFQPRVFSTREGIREMMEDYGL